MKPPGGPKEATPRDLLPLFPRTLSPKVFHGGRGNASPTSLARRWPSVWPPRRFQKGQGGRRWAYSAPRCRRYLILVMMLRAARLRSALLRVCFQAAGGDFSPRGSRASLCRQGAASVDRALHSALSGSAAPPSSR